MSKKKPKPPTVDCPFVVTIDTSEQHPYIFRGLRENKEQELIVEYKWQSLDTGDYSIQGYHDLLTVERKSKADLYSTLGQGRERFEAEHERMKTIIDAGGFAAVVIEAEWSELLSQPPEHSRLLPKTVYRTCLAWTQRYKVPWFAMSDRRAAEVTTFRLLERFWRDRNVKKKKKSA